LEPAAGPGLIFVALPTAFADMPFGHVIGGTFFVLLAGAALTSCVSVLEVIVAFVIKHLNWTRRKSVIVLSIITAVVAIPVSLSVGGPIADWKLFGKGVFDLFDFTASNILLPVVGLAVTIFIGYISKKGAEEAKLNPSLHRIWISLLRYVVPVFVILIFLYSTGLI
jgi:NSS family neurotransmitter:Na+ symporter